MTLSLTTTTTFCLIVMVIARHWYIRHELTLFFSLLGVLWEGTRMFDGVAEAMTLLREKGKN